MKKFIGLVGFGYWGKNIFRNLRELGVLYKACDSDDKRRSEYASQFPDVKFTDSFDELLKDKNIKAVAIATPAVTHFTFAKKALFAGKDVYVEKPLSLSVEEGRELLKIADAKNRIVMVGHILQYHNAVIKLKNLINNGTLGKINYIYSNRLNMGKLRTEENILWSFAPHDISVILMLLGEEPVNVTAFGGDYISKGIYDTTMTTLEFRNGVKGHIFVSWLHPFKEQKLIVVGTKAMAVFDDMSKEKLFLYHHKVEWLNGKIPVAQKEDYEVVPIEMGEPLKAELQHFIDCVKTRKTPVTDGKEGLRVLTVLEKCEKSLLGDKIKPPTSAEKDIFVHESSFLDQGVKVGKGTKIWHFSHILKGSDIGENCVIGQNVMIGPNVKIGNRCKIQNNVSVFKGVTLEDDVFCGPSSVFTNVYNPRAFVERKNEFKPTIVKKGATIGANATVICGNTIGEYALIGAGAVVKKDVPSFAVMVGVPAKQVGWVSCAGNKLEFNSDNIAVDEFDGSRYKLRNINGKNFVEKV